MTNELIGRKLGKYEIREPLGHGGMATVYKAYQSGLNRYVAIKVLGADLQDDLDWQKRFRQEASAVAALEHQNIVPVYDFGEEDNLSYLVMSYIAGGSLETQLEEYLRQSLIPPLSTSLQIVSAVARALDYAHSQGVLHRDVKPANILLNTNNWPFLSDFGISKLLNASSQFTKTGQNLGSPAYMSPEQIQGETLDGRADFYALGIVLYHLTTGHLPFSGNSVVEVLVKQLQEPPLRPRLWNDQISKTIERTIMRAVAKDRSYRYQNGHELARDLEVALAELEMTGQGSLPTKVLEEQKSIVDSELMLAHAQSTDPQLELREQPIHLQPVSPVSIARPSDNTIKGSYLFPALALAPTATLNTYDFNSSTDLLPAEAGYLTDQKDEATPLNNWLFTILMLLLILILILGGAFLLGLWPRSKVDLATLDVTGTVVSQASLGTAVPTLGSTTPTVNTGSNLLVTTPTDQPNVGSLSQLRIVKMTASSTHNPEPLANGKVVNYDIQNINDNDLATAWLPNEPIGAKITLELDGYHTIQRLDIFNGYYDTVKPLTPTSNLYYLNNTVAQIHLEFDPDQNGKLNTAQTIGLARLKPEQLAREQYPLQSFSINSITTNHLTITIESMYPGILYQNDTPIAELKIFGH